MYLLRLGVLFTLTGCFFCVLYFVIDCLSFVCVLLVMNFLGKKGKMVYSFHILIESEYLLSFAFL